MPAVIDPTVCNRNWALCFAARVCPEGAFSVRPDGEVVIDSSLCNDCSGPCTNFCDGYAIRYERDPDAFDILRRETRGELTEEAALEERIALAEAANDRAKEESAQVVIEVTSDTFAAEVINAELPVVVDFWATWCGPCKQMAPVFEELAREYAGLIKFVKVNVDDEQLLAGQYRIQSIPTLLVFYQGQPIDGAVGALPKPQLQSMLYSVLSSTHGAQAQSATAPQP